MSGDAAAANLEKIQKRTRANLDLATSWITPGYYFDVRCICDVYEGSNLIRQASLHFHRAKPTHANNAFVLRGKSIYAAQVHGELASQQRVNDFLERAFAGELLVADARRAHSLRPIDVSRNGPQSEYYAGMGFRLVFEHQMNYSGKMLERFDRELRIAEPPFDGYADLSNWLGLDTDLSAALHAVMNISVEPPVDLALSECTLTDNMLTLKLSAASDFDVSRVRLAIRSHPNGIQGRAQVSSLVEWHKEENGWRGVLRLGSPEAHSVLAMLLIDENIVRRQWFIDIKKAENARLLAYQLFDENLDHLRTNLLTNPDSKQFEKAVALVLFVLGFTASLSGPTDGPDVIAETPRGRILIVECTLKTSDLATKIGKLVDRRVALNERLVASGVSTEVLAVLVCRQKREQMAGSEELLRRVIVITYEDLATVFQRVRAPLSQDRFIDELLERNSKTSVADPVS